jgi:thiamine biosynthesis lipoprotein
MTADAFATAFMVMGVDVACRVAERFPQLAYYIIYAGEDGFTRIKYSDGMESKLVKQR